jgi:hypothetical protein
VLACFVSLLVCTFGYCSDTAVLLGVCYVKLVAAGQRHELVSDCSPIGVQVLCLFLAVR